MKQLPLAITNGQKYGIAMRIESDSLADAYWKVLVNHCMRSKGCTQHEAEHRERANLLYYAGYYDKRTVARVRALFGPNFPKEASA